MNAMSRFGCLTLVLGLWLGTGALGGCASNTEQRLWNQSTELQRELSQTQARLMEAERRLSRMEAENDRLRAERDALQSQPRATASALPGLSDPPTPAGLRTADFEGIDDVQTVRRGSTVTVTVQGDILFAPGQATLTDASRRTLAQVAQVLNNRYPRGVIRIVGHTDSDPIRRSAARWKDNYELSQGRANAVRDYLAERGVSRGRMVVSGVGADQPVADNRTAAGKAKNRRVEIVVDAQ
ncbi:MAG: OmpA family protein [Phycisphaeraceae bacterium]|nr:OmpA family protein [Phycisphaeraceae bacterium]